MGSMATSPEHTPSDYDALFISEWAGVVRYFRRAVGDDSLAEDLAQESFLRAAQGLATFRGDSSPRTWLRRIAANVLHDHWRRQPLQEGAMLRPWRPEDDLHLADRGESPALAIERRQAQACLAGLVAELPSGEREALTLAVGHDMRPREIARSLRLAPEAARARLHRARRKMAALLADRCVLATDEAGGLTCEDRDSSDSVAARPSDSLPPA